jgi:chaperonin GroES
VIAVGPGKLDDKGKPMELGVRNGDTVYYGKYSGTDVEIDGEKYVILREADILGVLE